MMFSGTFQAGNWPCRRETPRRHGLLLSLPYTIDVPANDGAFCMPYRFEMHDLGDGFFATDFSPIVWQNRPDRFSRLASREGFRVDFRRLVRVCFDIFRQEILAVVPTAIFVVCGSRTNGEADSSGEGLPTRKYRLYRAVFARLCAECECHLVDDASHSLFLVCPHARKENYSDLLSAYWRRRTRIDSFLEGVP